MNKEIEIKNVHDTFAYTIVRGGNLSITVWPGKNYLKDLENAKEQIRKCLVMKNI